MKARNFSPPGTIQELEDYGVDLLGGTVMELEILPHKSGGDARTVARESTFWLDLAEISHVNNKQTGSVPMSLGRTQTKAERPSSCSPVRRLKIPAKMREGGCSILLK